MMTCSHCGQAITNPDRIVFNETGPTYTIDDKTTKPLTVAECSLVDALLRGRGRVLSRKLLMEDVYGKAVSVDDRVIDSHVKRIRKKILGTGLRIRTIYSAGYTAELAPEGDVWKRDRFDR